MKIKNLKICLPVIITTSALGYSLGVGSSMLDNAKTFDKYGIIDNEGYFKSGIMCGVSGTFGAAGVCLIGVNIYREMKSRKDEENTNDLESIEKVKTR